MIRILVKGEDLYKFPKLKDAVEWIQNSPQIYDYDTDNLRIFSEKPLPGLIETIQEIQHSFACRGCGTELGFSRTPEEHLFRIHCPICDSFHDIEVYGDVGTSEG